MRRKTRSTSPKTPEREDSTKFKSLSPLPLGLLATACLTLACGEGGPGVEGTDYAIYEFGVGFQQLCYVVLVEERRAAVEQAVLWDYGPLVEECDPRIPEDADEQ